MCLGDVSDSISSCSVSRLHLGQLYNLKQCDGLSSSLTPFKYLSFPLVSWAAPVLSSSVSQFSPHELSVQSCTCTIHVLFICQVWFPPSPPPPSGEFSSTVCFHSWLWQTHYLCWTAQCIRQQRLAAFYFNIVGDGQCDIWWMQRSVICVMVDRGCGEAFCNTKACIDHNPINVGKKKKSWRKKDGRK